MRDLSAARTNALIGAYELKASYQTNFIRSMAITSAGIAVLVLVYLLMPPGTERTAVQVIPDSIIIDFEPPLTPIFKPELGEEVRSRPPEQGDIPVVVEDELFTDDALVAPPIETQTGRGEPGVDAGASGLDQLAFGLSTIADEEPDLNEFRILEVQPEMIHEVSPDYPRQAEAAGLEGTVWIASLVGIDGAVIRSQVMVSSGVESLDEAARIAALVYRYRPAIQNGRPVKCWVKYRVRFTLD